MSASVTTSGTRGGAGARTPLVSVVIPNYNCGRYLSAAVDSVLSQTYANLEVIVVDDGSTDQSESVLRSYEDRIRWLRQPNRGVSAARNLGIQESHGELVAFLDGDDLWRRDKLERQVPVFENPSVGLVYCGLEQIDGAGRPLGTRTSEMRGRVLRQLALLRGPGVLGPGSSAVLRRECLDRVGLFDTELSNAEDWDLRRRIACHYEIEVAPEPLVLYRLHGRGAHRNVAAYERDQLRAFERMFSDAAAREVHPLRRRCYANLYVTLAGSWLHAGDWRKAARWAARAVVTWPGCASYLAAFPARWLRRRLGAGADPAG